MRIICLFSLLISYNVCLQALEEQNGEKVGESTMEISLAKPQDNRAKENKKRREQERFRGGPPGRG